jgi:hypothetical protein
MIKNKLTLFAVSAVSVGASLLALTAHAADDYLITASDTIPIFQNGASAVKSNGIAVLNVAVPYLAGAAVAFSVILILWVVVSYFRNHRA